MDSIFDGILENVSLPRLHLLQERAMDLQEEEQIKNVLNFLEDQLNLIDSECLVYVDRERLRADIRSLMFFLNKKLKDISKGRGCTARKECCYGK